MRTVRRLFRFSVLPTIAIAINLAASVASAQTPAPPPAPTPAKLVYPPSDPAKDIAAALTASKADGKHVLIDFGADWCPDCRVLGALLEDASVAPLLESNFRVVHVDVGRRDKNADIVAKYKATSDAWIPAVVVLDKSGETIAVTDDKLRLTRRTSTEQLADILKQWAPKKSFVQLSSFREHGVDVAVTLERDSTGQVWLAGKFSPVAAGVHLYGKDLPVNGVDGMGRPTTIRVASGALTPRGAAIADRRAEDDRIEVLKQTLSIYPPGPVTMRVPVQLPLKGASTRAELSLTYMGCGESGCLPPVVDRRVTVTVPSRDQ